MHYVYLLECQQDKSWYIGQTDDLRARVKRHNEGQRATTSDLEDNLSSR